MLKEEARPLPSHSPIGYGIVLVSAVTVGLVLDQSPNFGIGIWACFGLQSAS
jgi:hypothetical protein